jgi:hypothetical protein
MMFKVVLVVFLIILASDGAWAAPRPARDGTAGKTAPSAKRKVVKKGLTPQQAFRLRKRAERDAKRHENEARRREYQLMLESQQRGMLRREQHPEKARAPEETR